MGDQATFATLLNAAVFLIPIAVLLTLVLLLLRRRRRRKPAPETSSEPHYAVSRSSLPIEMTAGPAVQTAERPPREPPVQVEDIETVSKKIETALARNEKTSLSSLYYDLAAGYGRLGNVSAQMSALRSATGYGALHGPPAAHAAARLALGEAAHLAGDLTSACEQWQMARTAFLQAGDAEQHARVEKRMRENGCPTDWVLTDF